MRFGLANPKNNLDQPEVKWLVFPSPNRVWRIRLGVQDAALSRR